MNNVDGLKKIYLLKSADYQFADIDLSDNTLLLGESGVGKTTLMRAILFFYTMDYSNSTLNINSDTKKTFTEWYFKNSNSHIVYEYTRGMNKFLFIVSSRGKLHYTFVDMTSSTLTTKELVLDEKMPVSIDRLIEKIKDNNLPNYMTSRKEKYINAFHKKDSEHKKIKQESQTNFTLFEDISSRKEFAKTLSNIFASSKVNSDSLKKTIVSLIENSDSSINLNEIRINLNDFVTHKKEIDLFEKKIPTIKKLSTTLLKYKQSKKEFKDKANQINAIKEHSSLKIEQVNAQIIKLETQKTNLQKDFELSVAMLTQSIQAKKTELDIESSDIKKLKEKEKEYKRKNIDKLLEEYHQEHSYQSSLSINKDKLSALTSNAKDINEKYKVIFENMSKDKNDFIFNLKSTKIDEDKKISDEINSYIKNTDENIDQATLSLRNSIEILDNELKTKEAEFVKTKIEKAKIQNHLFNQENINIFSQEIKAYELELSKLTPLLTANIYDIKNIEKDVKNVSKELKDAKDRLSDEIAKEKNELFAKKAVLEKKLDFESNNLYGYLNKNNIKNRQTIATYLKDEILFSTKTFSVKEVDDSNTIFGVALEFDEHLENEYEQEKLLKELELINTSLKECNKKAIVSGAKLESSASDTARKVEKQRSSLYSIKSDLEQKEKIYKHKKLISKTNLEDANKEAKKEKEQKIQELDKQYLAQELQIKSTKDKINSFLNEINLLTKAIKDETATKIKELEDKRDENEKSFRIKIDEINGEYANNKEKAKQELTQMLHEKGIDNELLSELQSNIKNLQIKINAIKKNFSFISVYLEEYQEKIKEIPTREVLLEKNRFILSNLENDLQSLKQENKSQNKNIQENIKNIVTIKTTLENFINSYNNKILNQEIEEQIKHSLSLSYEENIDELLSDNSFILSIIDDIIISYNKVQNDFKDIKIQTQDSLKGLDRDNIFKIEVIDDYIDTNSNTLLYINIAQKLVEYVEKDKIKVLKDASSEMFKSSINSIRKELNLFEETLLDIKSEVLNLKNTIRDAVKSFVVIDNIYIEYRDANNEVLAKIKEVLEFYSHNNEKFLSGLFEIKANDETQRSKDELAKKIIDLVNLLSTSKEILNLESGFVLEFKVVEKGNDLGWRQTLNDVGSNGTSTLVKSIINISMLQMVSKNIIKNTNMVTHCILDEIGIISTEYFKELKDFVNNSGFIFVNGMPTEDDILISMYNTVYVGENCGNYSKMLLASKSVV